MRWNGATPRPGVAVCPGRPLCAAAGVRVLRGARRTHAQDQRRRRVASATVTVAGLRPLTSGAGARRPGLARHEGAGEFKAGVLCRCSPSMRETARDQPRWRDTLGTRGNGPCASSAEFRQASSRTHGIARLPSPGEASSEPWVGWGTPPLTARVSGRRDAGAKRPDSSATAGRTRPTPPTPPRGRSAIRCTTPHRESSATRYAGQKTSSPIPPPLLPWSEIVFTRR